MSASIDFPLGATAWFWSSSFRIVHDFLDRRAAGDPLADRILRENPIAHELKCITLESFQRGDLEDFVTLLSELRTEATKEAPTWKRPEFLDHFLDDLAKIQEAASSAIERIRGCAPRRIDYEYEQEQD